MNLAEKFALSNAATESGLIRAPYPRPWQSWGGASTESELQFAYVMEDYLGIQMVTAGVFTSAATALCNDLQRSVVVDATGLIEQFSASNVSIVLAQPASALNVPRRVFLKRSNDVAQYREDNVHTYVVSDPFPALREELAQIGRIDPHHSQNDLASVALSNAAKVLDAARDEGVLPVKILRGSSGVFLYFSNNARYAEIECDNDGDIGVVMSDRSGNPTLWFSDSNQLRSDLARIRAFLL